MMFKSKGNRQTEYLKHYFYVLNVRVSCDFDITSVMYLKILWRRNEVETKRVERELRPEQSSLVAAVRFDVVILQTFFQSFITKTNS